MAQMDSAERLDKHLLPYIASVQTIYPSRLLMRGRLCVMAADLLSVTKQSVSARIAKAVAEERLIEIFPRADWMIALPEGVDLPKLFAMPDPAARVAYTLQRKGPLSRGAGGASFITTPDGLRTLLALTRERFDLPDPGDAEFYAPVLERRVRPDDYAHMGKILAENYPEFSGDAHHRDVLRELLSVLKLAPSQEP